MTDVEMDLDQEFFETLVDNGSDAIVSINKESTVVYANESVKRVFGYESEEIVGQPLTTVMPDRFEDAHFEAVESYLRTGEPNLDWNDIQLPAVHKDGHEIQLDITFEEHEYGGETVFSGIMRDITGRVERERRLERQNEQLEKFAGIISHDLRNPINAAQARLSLLQSEYDDDHLDELDDIHNRMATLIEDVLELTKQGQTVGETAPVALSSVARNAWSSAGAESAELVVTTELTLQADRERLRSLLENLLGNAVQHVDEEVTVTVGGLDEGTGFYVADDGSGIPEEERSDVFEYGYTTEDAGTGFGLNIVRSVAEAHGWEVTVTESEDAGARFEFEGVSL
jgi:PAS domain S-box-containing protein